MKPQRGFTLTEMLLAIALLGVFLILAARLITTNFDITTATLTADSNSARFDQATSMLRGDMSESVAVEMPQPQLLRIHSAGNHVVEWQTGPNTLMRTEAKVNRTWHVGHSLNLQLDGAVVLLSANPVDQIAMASPPKGSMR